MSDKRRILIVDPSRVARAALVKHLRDDFDIREENDGQAAWQTLVLDSSIAALIACINLERLNAFELVRKLRENRLQRLQDLPVILLISQDSKAEEREQAKAQGINDFILRGMNGDEIRRRIERLVNWEITSDFSGPCSKDPSTETTSAFPDRPALTRLLDDHLKQTSHENTPGCSIVAFGLSSADALASHFGQAVVEKISRRIALLIREKISRRDGLGCIDPGCFLIISPGTPLSASHSFAERICRALASQNVQIGKQRIRLETSMGIASLPADLGLDAAELIQLAQDRLALARQLPGEYVVSQPPEENQNETTALIRKLMEQMKQTQQIGLAGLQMMPLLQLMEQQFHFGLPLKQMETLFRQDARQASIASPTEKKPGKS